VPVQKERKKKSNMWKHLGKQAQF